VRDGRDEPAAVVDLSDLIDEALAAQHRGGNQWQRGDTAHVSIYAKPLALRRALDNLLDNAARHGAAPFDIELIERDHGGAIRVRDHGPGVEADALPQLGQPFYRADAARSGPGSGLGLATVMRVAAWHGGHLHLRNRDGGGFEAELTLVAARA
jgi:two-component system osmolarity sensor histidine kinase EnvZ